MVFCCVDVLSANLSDYNLCSVALSEILFHFFLHSTFPSLKCEFNCFLFFRCVRNGNIKKNFIESCNLKYAKDLMHLSIYMFIYIFTYKYNKMY